MVEKFKQILKKMEDGKGRVILFAVIKTDDLSDKWSVILCAGWANAENRDEVFKFIVDLFKTTLTAEENESIARIAIYQKDNYVVKSLLAFRTGFVIKEETKINGFTTHEGYILASNSEQ
jgi:hypothetical protein